MIKAELPRFGDQARWLPVQKGDSRSAYFAACNRGKRSVTVDLRRPEGREVFLRLAAWADVVITNFKPGTMESWGLGYEDLAERNPGVDLRRRFDVRARQGLTPPGRAPTSAPRPSAG